MCGIFGFSIPNGGASRFQRGILAYKLASLNDERGGHSWGILGLLNGEKVTHRGLGDMAPEASVMQPYRTMFAHTRFATTGAKTIENAHPFEHGPITGAHNGVIWNDTDLDKKYGRSFQVDSQHIFEHMANGIELSDIEGYGAIEWHDARKPDRIYMARVTTGGELSIYGIGTYENPMGVIWSSEENHLLEACATAGLKVFEYMCEPHQVHYVLEHKLYVDKQKVSLSTSTASRSVYGSHWSDFHDVGDGWERFSSKQNDRRRFRFCSTTWCWEEKGHSGKCRGRRDATGAHITGPTATKEPERKGESKNSSFKDMWAKYRADNDLEDPDDEAGKEQEQQLLLGEVSRRVNAYAVEDPSTGKTLAEVMEENGLDPTNPDHVAFAVSEVESDGAMVTRGPQVTPDVVEMMEGTVGGGE